MQCDICNKELRQEDGYLLTTSQVVLSTRYWEHLYDLVESGETPISIQQLEEFLPMQIQKMAGMSTDWLLCEKCIGSLDSSFVERKEVIPDKDWRTIDLEHALNKVTNSPWPSGPADWTLTGEVAVKAWEVKFGKKPNESILAQIVSLRDQAIKDLEVEKETEQNDLEQLVNHISSGNMNLEQLENVLKTINNQLVRYKEALNVIEKAGTDNWNYEVYAESLRIGSAGETKPIERQRWDKMFNKHRLELRTNAINYIDEGQRNFERIKTKVETELDRQREAIQKSGFAILKKWWQFWK